MSANKHELKWIVPDNVGSKLKLKATALRDPAVTDEYDRSYQIKGALALASPNKNDVLYVGETAEVTWRFAAVLTTPR